MNGRVIKGGDQRLAVFCFYDKDGIVDEYIEYLLKELGQCTKRLIIVVNGLLDQTGKLILKKYSNEIVIRENKGFDAGAYKDVLINYLTEQELQEYDELVLCNHTFFGPFLPFCKIFDKMKSSKCEFWGFNYLEDHISNYLQSNFLVFRKSVICERDFYLYFKTQIDEKTVVIKDVYAQFERGLFSFLVKTMKKTWASYIEVNNCEPYKSCNYCIKKYHLPLLKRKAFSSPIYNIHNVIDALQYIKKNTEYDISLIISSVNRAYGFKMEQKEVESFQVDFTKTEEYYIPISMGAHEKIERFINNGTDIYIYGTGSWARTLYWIYLRTNKKFKGFIVSDGEEMCYPEIFSHSVHFYSAVANKESIGIIVGLYDQVDEVRNFIKQEENVLYLW